MILVEVFRSRELETNASRHATGVYVCAYPAVAREFHYLMLWIAVKLQAGSAPGERNHHG